MTPALLHLPEVCGCREMADFTELNLALECPSGTSQPCPRLFSLAIGTPMIFQYSPMGLVYHIEHSDVQIKIGTFKGAFYFYYNSNTQEREKIIFLSEIK